MPTYGKVYTLDENLVLTNEELTSNISKLASLIRSYEGGEWDAARTKAGQLLKDKEAIEYIETVRANVAKGETPKPVTKTTEKATASTPQIYRINFDQLATLVPELEETLSTEPIEKIFGKSVRTGYYDLFLRALDHDKAGYYISLAQYRTYYGETISDPEMELFVSLKNKTVEALNYEGSTRYAEVYPNKRDRKMVNTEEQKSQNEFLTQWLSKLIKQGHEIEWKDKPEPKKATKDESKEEPDSVVVDQFDTKPDRKTGKGEPDSKRQSDQSGKSDSDKQKIETLFGDLSGSDGKKALSRLEKVIRFKEGNSLSSNRLEERIEKLAKDGSAAPYLFDIIDKLLTLDGGHLMSLNYYKLLDFIPNLLKKLTGETVSVLLKSTKSDSVYTVKFGNRVSEDIVLFGIYEQNEKEQRSATMLIKVRTADKLATVDHVSGDFFNLATYAPDKIDPFQNEYYFALLGFHEWLNSLVKGGFAVEWTGEPEPEPVPVADAPAVEQGKEDPEEHDNNYINKNIPDFEPGHVELTATHKKHGVTQKMINRVNKTQKGITVFPRKQKMVFNTKNRQSDLDKIAQPPGFRLSKTGKLYYEGRSNRADRTRDGY